MKWDRRFLSLLVTAGMAVSMIPTQALAASPAYEAEAVVSLEQADLPCTPEESEKRYLDKLFYGEPEVSLFGDHSLEDMPRLDETQRELHDWLAPFIQNIADNGGSTCYPVPKTARLIGLRAQDNAALQEEMGRIIRDVVYALYCEHPENFYWSQYGRCVYAYTLWRDEDGFIVLDSININFIVSRYKSEDPKDTSGQYCYGVDNQKIQRAIASKNNAVAEAEKIRTMTVPQDKDPVREKLWAITNRICELNTYNYAAVDPNYTGPDDSQNLVDVFDNDPNTNVVCAGYAVACQYLCDLVFPDGEAECYFVTGDIKYSGGGGLHAWNVVRIQGESYLLDLTCCDWDNPSGPAAHNTYFMLSPKDGNISVVERGRAYLARDLTYTYDQRTLDLFSPAVLTLTETAPTSGTITDVGRSLSLEGEIHINQYAKITGFEGVDIEKDGGLLIWNSPVTEETATFETADVNKPGLQASSSGYSQETDGIASARYADTLYLRIYVRNPDGTYTYGPLKEYSVRTYCESRISKNTSIKDTCVALLHYGAASQLYFGYNTDDLANKNIVQDHPSKEWDPSYLTPLLEAESTLTASDLVRSKGKSLSLEGSILVNFYFDTDIQDVKSSELLVWESNAAPLSEENVSYRTALTKDGSMYRAESQDFVSCHYGKTIFACARFEDQAGNVYYSETIAYSPETYAANKISQNTNPKLVDTVKKMVMFGEEAQKYFHV